MSSSQKAKEKEVAEPEASQPEIANGDEHSGSDLSDEEHEHTGSTLPQASTPSTSSKKRKKKRSKAVKALNALRTGHKDGIPQNLVHAVLDKVREEGGEAASEADETTVRMALEQMNIKDLIQGKAGVGGKNRKDAGDHKVSSPWSRLQEPPAQTFADSSGRRSLCPS